MTRQKRELLRQIQQMERSIEIDTQQGPGYAPPAAFDRVYEEIYKLQEELAHLRHYRVSDFPGSDRVLADILRSFIV